MVDSFVEHDKHYLMFTDRMSRYPAIYEIKKPNSPDAVIQTLLDLFQTFRCPDTLICMDKTPFTAQKTQQFLGNWNVKVKQHTTINSDDKEAEEMLESLRKITQKHSQDEDRFGEELMKLRNAHKPDS